MALQLKDCCGPEGVHPFHVTKNGAPHTRPLLLSRHAPISSRLSSGKDKNFRDVLEYQTKWIVLSYFFVGVHGVAHVFLKC